MLKPILIMTIKILTADDLSSKNLIYILLFHTYYYLKPL